MKLKLLAALLLTATLSFAQGPADVRVMVEKYCDAIRFEPQEVKSSETDFLISSASSDSLRSRIAVCLYEYYMASNVMGDEAQAVHLLDKWFSSGEVSFGDPVELLNAQVWADFNRCTLLGCKAPELLLATPDGEIQKLIGEDRDRLRILYFYAPDCNTCKAESILIRHVLEEGDYPVEFCAVNTRDDRAAWDEYRSASLDIKASRTVIRHLWDPDAESGLERLYGVLQTPRLLLAAPDGTILGRGLDALALKTLLEEYLACPDEYGAAASTELFDGIFSTATAALTGPQVRDFADYLWQTSGSDPRARKSLVGDLLYYLFGRPGKGIKEGASYVADSLVLSREELWWTPADTMQVVSLARLVSANASLSPIGSPLPNIKVSGTLRTPSGSARKFSGKLSKLKVRDAYAVFFSHGCSSCEGQLSALDDFAKGPGKGASFLLIDTDVQGAKTSQQLAEAFDLLPLPLIIRTSRAVITDKYISFTEK